MTATKHVIIVGGGVAGLTSALAYGRAGHRVTLYERDPLPATADAEAAFAAERRGAPQAHQTHGFLARMQVLMRERFPDVRDALLEAGAFTLSSTANLGEPQPGDDDLKVIVTRRTTLEWVLRTAVLAADGVTINTDAAVAGLTGSGTHIDGVRLTSGTTDSGDVVVVATGRRGDVPAWIHDALGIEIPETVVESGLMYLTRWYRLPADFDRDPLPAKLGGDLGFVKFLGVPGDGGTLSITLAIRPDDTELRQALSDPDGFEQACRLLPGPDQFFAGGPLEPVGGVRPMTGLLNRLRAFHDDGGTARVTGIHAVGDAHTATNPLYGRGCSLAMVQAVNAADALADHPDDPAARGAAYEAANQRDVEPWYHSSVEMDRAGADPASSSFTPDSPLARVFAAAETDPILGRGFARLWNLLITPAELAADQEHAARAMYVITHPDEFPIPARPGPKRDELLAALSSPASAPPTAAADHAATDLTVETADA